jgi:hypothetical protein
VITKTVKLADEQEFTLAALTIAETRQIDEKVKAGVDVNGQNDAYASGVVMSINKAASGGSMTVDDLLGKVTMGGLNDLLNVLAELNTMTISKGEAPAA